MINIKRYLYVFGFLNVLFLNAQTVDIYGQLVANEDLEGIHIINKTSQRFTISETDGSFIIPAKLNDTIQISGIKYLTEEIVIGKTVIDTKNLTVFLTVKINTLDEVIVGKILTGDLKMDIGNSDAKRDLDFYDVGIPGYTGKRMTQNEQRLYEADHGKFVNFYGLYGTVNFHKLLNAISGRTKRLKNIVRLESQDVCMNRIIADYSESLLGEIQITDELKAEFFYFASEDSEFLGLCGLNNSMKMFEFLQKKLSLFMKNREETKD